MAWSLQGKTSANTVFFLSLNPCLIHKVLLTKDETSETIVWYLFSLLSCLMVPLGHLCA